MGRVVDIRFAFVLLALGADFVVVVAVGDDADDGGFEAAYGYLVPDLVVFDSVLEGSQNPVLPPHYFRQIHPESANCALGVN